MEDSIFVCGGGHQGLSMAAHLSLNGIKVSIYNRTEANIALVKKTHTINCKGIVNGKAYIDKCSSSIKEVFSDFIMVTTPSSAHKDIARLVAPYVKKDTIIVLNPGRTFGAIEFANELLSNGVKELPIIAETQTIIYTCRRDDYNSTTIYAIKEGVKIATLNPEDIGVVMERMPECIAGYFVPVTSVLETSLSNVGMVLHCAPVLMNIGWIESPLVDFNYYYDGISPSIANFLEKIDYERVKVAEQLGIHVESLVEWLNRTYNSSGTSIYECIKNTEAYKKIYAPHTIRHRYILEDVPCGLVPVEYIGCKIGVGTPNIKLIIDLANSVMDYDFRKNGRKYDVSEWIRCK